MSSYSSSRNPYPAWPFVASGGLGVAAIVWSLRLAFAPEPLAASSAALVAASMLTVSLITIAGILVPRARWGRRLAYGVIGLSGLLGVIYGPDGWTFIAMVPTTVGLAVLVGPWLDSWLRRFPAADGPPWRAMAIPIGGVLMPAAVAFARPGGVGVSAAIYAALIVVVAWLYSRAHLWALWVLRLGLVPGALLVGVGGSIAGIIGLTAWALALSILAWSRDAARAVRPLMTTLPPPRVGTARERTM